MQMLVEGAAAAQALEVGVPNVLAVVECNVGTSLVVSMVHVGVQPVGQALETLASALWPSTPRHFAYVLLLEMHASKAASQAEGH